MDITKQKTVENLAHKLMHEYLSVDWDFAWSKRKRAFGTCHYREQLIKLSILMMKGETMDAIEQTLRHEIAHAVVGPGHGHNATWKRAALSVGVRNPKCSRDYTADESDIPTPKWVLVFGNEIIARYYRRPGHRRINSVHLTWARGRKAETMGHLQYMPYRDYLDRLNGITKPIAPASRPFPAITHHDEVLNMWQAPVPRRKLSQLNR